MKKCNYTFFDFLGDIVDVVINNNGKHDDPYNINFTNHYKTLYDVEQKLKEANDDKEVKFDEIVQNKRDKSLTVSVSGMKIGKEDKESFIDFINEELNRAKNKTGKKTTVTINGQGGFFSADDDFKGITCQYTRSLSGSESGLMADG